MSETLSCGHAPTITHPYGPAVSSLAGYGTDPATGARLCLDCCDRLERERIASGATSFVGYLAQAPDFPPHGWGKYPVQGHVPLTSYVGGELARVTHLSRAAKRENRYGSRVDLTTVYAVTPDGRRWWGRFNEHNGQAVAMRVLKQR